MIHIYIPIWRDLKDRRSAFFKDTQFNLHSNMERFKVFFHNVILLTISYLHSNMERFKGANLSKSQSPCMEFTFQYGEI